MFDETSQRLCAAEKKQSSHVPGQITVDSIDAIQLIGLGQCHEENHEQKPQIAQWHKGERGSLSCLSPVTATRLPWVFQMQARYSKLTLLNTFRDFSLGVL